MNVSLAHNYALQMKSDHQTEKIYDQNVSINRQHEEINGLKLKVTSLQYQIDELTDTKKKHVDQIFKQEMQI